MVWLRKCIGHAKGMVETTGPEFDVKVGAQEQGANSVGKSAMIACNGSVLKQVIRTCGMNHTFLLCKQVANFRIIE